MPHTSCKKVFVSLKKTSRKFNPKRLSKKNGLYDFYALAEKNDKNNKNVYNALKKASRKVKPYDTVTNKGLYQFFSSAEKNMSSKKCKGVFPALKKAALISKYKPNQKVSKKCIHKFYNRASKHYNKSNKHKRTVHKRTKSRRHKKAGTRDRTPEKKRPRPQQLLQPQQPLPPLLVHQPAFGAEVPPPGAN